MVGWQQDYEKNRMVTLAAMIDRVDQEVGRLIEDLKKNGEYENTLILFVSDNGACPYDRKKPLLNVEPTNGDISLADSTGWSWARNAPFRFYKQNQFEGGISTPGIIHWPAGLKTEPGSIVETPTHLIDVLPTLAEISGSKIPDQFADRDLRPVSGISLLPLLEGKELNRAEPIHLQFSNDYGLRDGDWKLVSYKGQAWELYHIPEDRTELNNLADSEPERLKQMVEKWKAMSKNVLHSGKLANPKISPAIIPRAHREWTKYSDSETPPDFRKQKTTQIRARKNTKMKQGEGIIKLTFTGEDPGIAMDLRDNKSLPEGPYRLSFELTTDGKGSGDIFYTVDPKNILPRGERITFPVNGTEAPQPVSIELKTEKRICLLRLDVSEDEGSAEIRKLQLHDAKGRLLKNWTEF